MSKIDYKIDSWLDSSSNEELSSVASNDCSICYGKGYYLDDPSPPGIPLSPGYYSLICECLDYKLILAKISNKEKPDES